MIDIVWREVAATLLLWSDQAILLYFLGLNSFYLLLLALSIPEIWSHYRLSDDEYTTQLLGSEALPPVSLLVPAYNEENAIAVSVLSFLTLRYPRHEVVLVNDGSKDGTMDALIREYDLYQVPPAVDVKVKTKPVHAYYRSRRFSRLLCVDKENGGKADALNAGLNAARYEYVIALDADTLIDPDALLRLARPFMLKKDIAAVGGTIRVANACDIVYGRVTKAAVDRRWLPGIQTVEYLRAYLFGRLGWNRLGGNLIISGAFGLFKRRLLMEIGGYQTKSIAEDMDLVVRLHKYIHENRLPHIVSFVPDPVAWTEVPTDLGTLRKQRERWHRGLIGTLILYKNMLFNPRYGKVGMISLPFYLFGEMFAPIIELLGYVGVALGLAFGLLNLEFALLFLCVAVGYGLLLSLWAVVLEELTYRRYSSRGDFAKLLWFAVIESFGYRQLTVLFRLEAFWKHMRGVHSWGEMKREGFRQAANVRPANILPTPDSDSSKV